MLGGRGTKTLIGAAAVVMMLGAACSKSSSSTTNPTLAPSTSLPTSASPSSAAGVTLQQGAGGFVFAPTTLTVKKGESINVKNVGTVAHTFTITGKGIDVVNNPGQSQQVTINLPAGTYQFICRFHVSLGMKGTLTVTG
jgi:plastocyanin